MKKLALMLLLPCLVVVGCTSQQSTGGLKLSSQYPAAGEKITFTYNPAGTSLAGKTGLEGIVYFLDNKDYPAADIDLKADGKLLTGGFTIPANTKFFIVKLSKDDSVDNNKDKGYTYFIYKDKQPVQGANALKASTLWRRGEYLAKIKRDMPQALSLYQKEFELYPASKKDYQSDYTYALLSTKDSANKTLALKEIMQMAQSNNGKMMSDAVEMLAALKKTAQADSLKMILKVKFPVEIAKSDLEDAFDKLTDPVKMEAVYNEFVQKYPEVVAEQSLSERDEAWAEIAEAYLTANKPADYDRIVAKMKYKRAIPGIINEAAWGNRDKPASLDLMTKMSKLSVDMVKDQIKNPEPGAFESPKMAIKNYKASLNMFSDTYAYLLAKQGKLAEAYNWEHPIYMDTKGMTIGINENYENILKRMHNDKEAIQVTETAIKNGKTTAPMMADLKVLYVKAKGNADGYDTYLASLKDAYLKKLRNDLAKQMLNKPAPAFALKDFDGKTVSLADLKGKVVVVDFWATWCGPCKASFPGMQMAVTKFKDNPNVKFVFIDTWETGDNYQDIAKKFIAANKYSFKILEDEKGSDGRQSKIVTAYGVDGIPTKFVLDSNGNIRFIHIGFEGSDEGVFDEVSTMIDLTAHQGATTAHSGQKVSMTVN